MRFLGIDYGKKRVGVALSDESGKIAFPETVLKNDRNLFENIKKICSEKQITGIVLGESLDFQGKPNLIMPAIMDFKEKLERELEITVYLEPEFLTTKQASAIQSEDKLTDARAAAIILQSFLDKQNQ